MNSKKFEYTNKDVPFLKKDIIFRSLFSSLFLIIFIWQFVSLIIDSVKGNMSILKVCSSMLVFICCLILMFISLLYVFKDFRIMAGIKLNGSCVSSVQMLIRTNKKSFIWLYSLLIKFLTLVTSLVLICSITYSFLQVTYTATTSFYLPLLLMICVSGFNSIYHIKDEMNTQDKVQELNNY